MKTNAKAVRKIKSPKPASRDFFEKKRDIGQEIIDGIREIKAGRWSRRFTVDSFWIVRAREKSKLSQTQFAALLGVSVRTLQEWEQGRRKPTTAAKNLIMVVEKHPEILKELVA